MRVVGAHTIAVVLALGEVEPAKPRVRLGAIASFTLPNRWAEAPPTIRWRNAMKTLLATALYAALGCASLAHAGSLVDVSVIDRDTGSTLRTYAHDGKLFVAGTPGHRLEVLNPHRKDVPGPRYRRS